MLAATRWQAAAWSATVVCWHAPSRAVDGVVRVRIVVDGAGHVTRATVAQGTNIADTSIRNAALAAARATRFNAVAGAEEQEGIITYRFKIQD